MPVQLIASLFLDGPPPWFPDPYRLLKVGAAVGAVALTKWYASGRRNPSERNMHGRVVLVTGGTSGVGAQTAFELARRGAQIVLLTRQPPSDPFLADFVGDLRARSGNQLVYAEQVDLADLHSVRQFATRWIDNAPPRRLDMIVLCAATLTPPGRPRVETAEGVEMTWMVNYLANFHLLGILSPAIRAQPFDRDVRIVVPTCSSYISAPKLDADDVIRGGDDKDWTPSKAYARSKLALMVFAKAYQKHLDAHKRPDGLPTNTRVVLVDPGYARTPGMTRWLTRGSLWGLLLYVLLYPLVWVLLKSANSAAQSLLYAAMDGSLGRGAGGRLIKECMEVDCARRDVDDEEVAKKLWEESDKLIERIERQQAVKRAKAKKEQEKRDEEAKQAAQIEEIEALVGAIKKGKAKEAKAKEAKQAKTAPKKNGKKTTSGGDNTR
ncbi:b779453f-2d6c-405c-8ac7-d3b7fe3a289d [Thermothielavioides terrestris]|uniref:B779453f-2d6c-405c-8ac7-d3b7fe3a289d n=1 Tax=Thermothielavioides terrestris TaxID=2587410 RepID=A0A446BMA5_9PEZI|nr:b779453f-2d6c-405c-8ac7-d3b7fe3a289d [Thermothielavioides terrestris]